jgi:hypothetical protein
MSVRGAKGETDWGAGKSARAIRRFRASQPAVREKGNGPDPPERIGPVVSPACYARALGGGFPSAAAAAPGTRFVGFIARASCS